MQKTDFGRTKDGQQVTKYKLTNRNGMTVSIIDLGATIVSVEIPVRGKIYDVVLGYDSAADYEEQTSYFGAVIGRNCNRIANAKVVLAGKEYQMEQNDNENNLHCGKNGFSKKVWTVEEVGESIITFSILSRDMEQDLPGNMTAKVTYRLTDENELVISYEAVTDQTTIANFTNHAYFNLDGHDSGRMEEQELEILASYYTPVVDSKSIPTGDVEKVAGTPMDFRKMKKIGADIHADFIQLKYAGGYDHNFVLDKADGTMQLAARAKAAKSGIGMDVYTDCVGLQLYAGNFIGEQIGKGGVKYGNRHGFCLETQYFPNAINEANFKSPILNPGEKYQSMTKYCFSVED
ncbi:MAG: aldose epimerase family protein [Roseburia sp.]